MTKKDERFKRAVEPPPAPPRVWVRRTLLGPVLLTSIEDARKWRDAGGLVVEYRRVE